MSTGAETMTPLASKLRDYALLLRLNRPIGTLLLLWPTLWALWIAGEGTPSPLLIVVFVLGVFIMRAAGCAINDFADREVDPHVKRTKQRPLATGRVKPAEAVALAAGLALLAFLLVVLATNRLTMYLALVGAVLAATYPFMKRYTYLPQIHLGAAFGWAVPMAFAAQTGAIPREAWLLFIAVVLWATAYDTMYAMVDRDDDLRIGVKSTAILFGETDRAWVGVIQAATLGVLALVGLRLELGLAFYMGLLAATGFAVYQQYLIRDRERQACFRAFLNNNWLGASVFAGLILHYVLGGGA